MDQHISTGDQIHRRLVPVDVAQSFDAPKQVSHQYKPHIIFLMDVQVDTQKLNSAIWSAGPHPSPCSNNDSCTDGNYGGDWRSTKFPSTLAPVMYGRDIFQGNRQVSKEPRLHSLPISFDATTWFNQVIQVLEAENSKNKKYKERLIESFIIDRAELQLFDNQGNNNTFGQLALYTRVETQFIGRVHDIFTVLTREVNTNSAMRNLVPGSFLYDLLDSPEVRCSPATGTSGVFDGVDFYTNETYLRDTEAKIYSMIHLRISENTCRETIDFIVEDNKFEPYNGMAWQIYQAYLAANLKFPKLITDKKARDRQINRIRQLSPGRYALITRLGASYLALEDPTLDTSESELYFLAEHVDAVMIARLHDQILRHAEVDLVTGMGKSTKHTSFKEISREVLDTYHQFTANSVRYWMDDVTANSGLGMTSLSSYKKVIDYQKRYDAMRTKIEDIAMLATQDKQNQIRDEQQKAHQRQLDITNKQQNIFLLLTIISAVAIPASFFNDGMDFLNKVPNPSEGYDSLTYLLIFGYVIIGVVGGTWFYRHYRAHKGDRARENK